MAKRSAPPPDGKLPYDSSAAEHVHVINRLMSRTDRLFAKVAEHEEACHARNEKDAVEMAGLKVAVSHNAKLLWGLIAGMLGLLGKEMWAAFLHGPVG